MEQEANTSVYFDAIYIKALFSAHSLFAGLFSVGTTY